jgi:sigma-B regulation protein RsbU (phosphoserine phosphatase)
MNLAIEEWMANVVNYAYPKGTRGHVEVTADMSKDMVLKLVIKDHGVPFDPTQYKEADTLSDLEDRPIGGLGIHMIRTIMDTMTYERSANGYNILTLTKKINKTD